MSQTQSNPPPTGSSYPLHWPAGWKQKIKDGLVALSLANLIFLQIAVDLLAGKGRFFAKVPVTTTPLLAYICNLLAAALVIWLLFRATRRLKRQWLRLPFYLAFMAAFFWPLNFIRLKIFHSFGDEVIDYVKMPAVMLAVFVLLVLGLWQYRALAKWLAVFCGVLSPLAVWHLLRATGMAVGILHLPQCEIQPVPAGWHPVAVARPRVVWIIFDETDYRLVFAQRPPNVQLPEFDRLHSETLSSTRAYPPGDFTKISMPSFITGERVVNTSPGDDCDATLTFATGRTANWRGLPSVFARAQELGFNTGLVGWYLPYSRLVGDALNYCSWYSMPDLAPARSTNFIEEVFMQLSSLGESFDGRYRFGEVHRHNLADALQVTADGRFGLTLLHLPAPHLPGVYLADRNQFTIRRMNKVEGYLNNLALADRELGEIRRSMEAAGLWDKTWIIVSSDHSWRGSRHYDKVRDLRVPFLVKIPGTNVQATYSNQFNTVLTHDLILAILQEEVTNQQSVVDWLDAHAPAQHDIPDASRATDF